MAETPTPQPAPGDPPMVPGPVEPHLPGEADPGQLPNPGEDPRTMPNPVPGPGPTPGPPATPEVQPAPF